MFHNWSGPYLLREKVGPTDFMVAQAHDLKPLKNQIHINRMKRFHHRAVVPPKPTDLQEIAGGQPAALEDLHPVDQTKLLPVNNRVTQVTPVVSDEPKLLILQLKLKAVALLIWINRVISNCMMLLYLVPKLKMARMLMTYHQNMR